MLVFSDVVSSPTQLMGVKAVWGRLQEGLICFGSRGEPKSKAYYSQARITAEKSQQQRYLVTIGGGEQVPDELNGRIVELIRVTGVYGDTNVFVHDEELRKRLAQWPVAVVVSEVYSIAGDPHLIDDLGFSDRSILSNAYDTVVHNEEKIQKLCNAIKDKQIIHRKEIQPPEHFHDPNKVLMAGTFYPKLDSSSLEGNRIWKEVLQIERDSSLAKAAKEKNKLENNGFLVCEACKFTDAIDGMFDAHHLDPISNGSRESRIDDLAILCPTCHRWAHAKAKDKIFPLQISEISKQRIIG